MLKTNYATHTQPSNETRQSCNHFGSLWWWSPSSCSLITACSLHFTSNTSFWCQGCAVLSCQCWRWHWCWHWDKLVLDCSNLPGSCCLVSSSAGLLGVRCARQLCTLPLALSQLNCAVWTVQDCTQLYRTVSAASTKLYSTHNVIIL